MADKRGVLAVNSNFARAYILSGSVSVLWVIVFVTTERKMSSTANDTTGSSPVQRSTTQIHTKESSFPARNRNPGRTEQWWQNLYNGILPESEWKKNLRVDRDVFIVLADEIQQPHLSDPTKHWTTQYQR